MPMYEYKCKCGAKEEKLETLAAPAEHPCPECKAPEGMQRRISRTSFKMKPDWMG